MTGKDPTEDEWTVIPTEQLTLHRWVCLLPQFQWQPGVSWPIVYQIRVQYNI